MVAKVSAMELVHLACLKASCLKGHHIYRAVLNVGDVSVNLPRY